MLPPLEGEIRLEDRTGQGFDTVARNAERANRALERTQSIADRAAVVLERVGRQRGITAEQFFGDLSNTTALSGPERALELLEDRAASARRSLLDMGRPDFSGMFNQLQTARDRIRNLEDGWRGLTKEIAVGSNSFQEFAGALTQLDDTPVLRSLPGTQELANLGELSLMMPRVATGALSLAGALGLVGIAGVGVVAGLGAVANHLDAMEIEQAQKGRLAKRFGIEPSEVNQAIDEVQELLSNRLSEAETLTFLLQVDPSGAIGSISEFGEVAQAVQAYSDKFGLDWRTALGQVIEAINNGDGAFLEQMGLIESSDEALGKYAESIDKNILQLTDREKKEALIQDILQATADLMTEAPTAAGKVRESHDRLTASVKDSTKAFSDWFAEVNRKDVTGVVGFYAATIDGWANALDRLEQFFEKQTAESQLAEALTEQEMAGYRALQQRQKEVGSAIESTREAIEKAQAAGVDTSDLEEFNDFADELESTYSRLDKTISDIQDKAAAGEDVKVPGVEDFVPPQAPARLGDYTDVFALPESVLPSPEVRAKIDETIRELESQLQAARGRLDRLGQERRSAFAQRDVETFERLDAEIQAAQQEIASLEERLVDLSRNPLKAMDASTGVPVQIALDVDYQPLKTQLVDKLATAAEEAAVVVSNDERLKQLEDRRRNLFQEVASITAEYSAISRALAGELALPVEQQDQATIRLLEEYLALLSEKRRLLNESQSMIASQGIGGLDTIEAAVDPAVAQIDQKLNGMQQEILAAGERIAENISSSQDALLASVVTLAGGGQAVGQQIVSAAEQQSEEIISAVDVMARKQGEVINDLNQNVTVTPVADTTSNLSAGVREMLGLLGEAENRTEGLVQRVGDLQQQSFRVPMIEAGGQEEQAATAAAAAFRILGEAKTDLAVRTVEAVDRTRQSAIVHLESAAMVTQEAEAVGRSAQAKIAAVDAVTATTEAYDAANISRARYLAYLAEENAQADNNVMVAGMLFDATSMLPVAFDTAGASAQQLISDFLALETEMARLENSAISTAFTVANRLAPALGIGGALQQAGVFAEQARQVRQTFDSLNEQRVGRGQDPLGTQVLDTALGELQRNWSAQATDIVAGMKEVGAGAGGMADAMDQATQRMHQALDGPRSCALKDSTKGLIPLDDLLPRQDEVDEPARRMADIAIKGFTSPWFEGLSNLFPEEVLAAGEGKVKEFAARMVSEHQKGLTNILYDTDTAAQRVIDLIQAKQQQAELVAEVRSKVLDQADVSDLDIMEALGIDVAPQRMAGAIKQSASDLTLSFSEIIGQLQSLGDEESPIANLMTVTEEDNTAMVETATEAMKTVGEAMVVQAEAGQYGGRSIEKIVLNFAEKKADLEKSGRDLANWMGDALLTEFSDSVPVGLLDILVLQLVPLIIAQMNSSSERTSGTGAIS